LSKLFTVTNVIQRRKHRLGFEGMMLLLLINACQPTPQKLKYRQENAVWSQSLYFRGELPASGINLKDDDIKIYANTLRLNHIKYIYVFSGPFGKNGHLPAYAFSATAKRSVRLFKKFNPELIVLPWIGGIQNKTVFLQDSTWVRNALNDTKRLVSILQVEGVHIDFEHILPQYNYIDSGLVKNGSDDLSSYPGNVNRFHQKLRRALPSSFISAVVLATSPGTRPWKSKTPISALSELSKYVNQIDFLYYDTSINDLPTFQANCDDLTDDIAKLKSQKDGSKVSYLIALGTFQNPSSNLQSFRNMDIENLPSSLSVIKRSLSRKHQSDQLIDGIALFCDWQTDEDEWKAFREGWQIGKS
jgi:hypothetical protein